MMGHQYSHHNHNTNKGFAYHPSHFYAAAAASALPQGTRVYTSAGMPPGPPTYAPPTYTQVTQQQTQGAYNNNHHLPLQLTSQAFPPLHVTTSTFTFPPTFSSVQPPPQQHSSVPLRTAHLRPTPTVHHPHHHAPSAPTTLGALINHIHQQQHQQTALNSAAGASHLQALHRHQQQQHNLQQQHKQQQQQQVGQAWLQQLAAHNAIQSQQPTTFVQLYPVEQPRQVTFSKRTNNNTYGLNMNAFILKAEGVNEVDGGETKAKEETKVGDEEQELKVKEDTKIGGEETKAEEETTIGDKEEDGKKSPTERGSGGSDSPGKDKVDPPTIKGYKGEDYYVDERNNTWHFRPVTINTPGKLIPGGYSPMPLISVCRRRDRRRWSHQLQHMHQLAASGSRMGRFWGTAPAPAFQPAPPEECFLGLEPPPPIPEDVTGIREVWKHNLSIEFQKIRELVKSNFCYIAMDTEFPGTVARPVGEFKTSSEYQYELIRVNCDLLKLIQLGITFLDKDGNFPDGITTWQFNFKFNLKEDMYAEDSIKMLTKCGIQFAKHESDGIDPQDFAYYMISSGMVLDESVTWISFHSGYDLGHLYRIMTGKNLPKKEEEFFAELKLYFPKIFDVKCLMTACKSIKGGLQECAEILDVERVGYQHQAGSDSYVTGLAFFRIQEVFYDDTDPVAFNGHVFGLDCNYSKV